MGKPGVMFYFNMRPSSKLSDMERLQLYDAILDYGQTGEVPNFSGALGVAWDYIQPTLDEDSARYEATREKRAKAGTLGGSAKAKAAKQDEANVANASDAKQKEASEANASDAKQKEANVANQANSIQYSSIQSNSVQLQESKADKPPTRPRFSPPSVEEVAAYCREKGYTVDAERFVDYYASVGWKRGSTSIKDWKAAVRTWARKDAPKPATPAPENCGYITAPLEDPWEIAMRERGQGNV